MTALLDAVDPIARLAAALAAPRFWLVIACTAAATALARRWAPRLGLVDGRAGPQAARKLQEAPVPTVGGCALALGLVVAGAQAWSAPAGWLGGAQPAAATGAALFGVFLVGLWDDRRRAGLPPLAKLVLSAVALAPLGWGAWAVADEGAVAGALLTVLVALCALHVVNTFDNADGAVVVVGALGLVLASPLAAAALLGFAPFNLDAGRGDEDAGRRAPSAYLGDSGAFLVALLLVLHPCAWGALWIPALDLARLCVVRTRAGQAPWVGDRRHLAHRLQARGWSARAVAAALGTLALPGILGTATFVRARASALAAGRSGADGMGFLIAGAAVGLALYLCALRLAPPAARAAT